MHLTVIILAHGSRLVDPQTLQRVRASAFGRQFYYVGCSKLEPFCETKLGQLGKSWRKFGGNSPKIWRKFGGIQQDSVWWNCTLASEFGLLWLILAWAFGSFQPKFAKCAHFSVSQKRAPTLKHLNYDFRIPKYLFGSCSTSRPSQRGGTKQLQRLPDQAASSCVLPSAEPGGFCGRCFGGVSSGFFGGFWSGFFGGFLQILLESPSRFLLKTFPAPVKQRTTWGVLQNFSKIFPYEFSLLVGLLLFSGRTGLAWQPPAPVL